MLKWNLKTRLQDAPKCKFRFAPGSYYIPPSNAHKLSAKYACWWKPFLALKLVSYLPTCSSIQKAPRYLELYGSAFHLTTWVFPVPAHLCQRFGLKAKFVQVIPGLVYKAQQYVEEPWSTHNSGQTHTAIHARTTLEHMETSRFPAHHYGEAGSAPQAARRARISQPRWKPPPSPPPGSAGPQPHRPRTAHPRAQPPPGANRKRASKGSAAGFPPTKPLGPPRRPRIGVPGAGRIGRPAGCPRAGRTHGGLVAVHLGVLEGLHGGKRRGATRRGGREARKGLRGCNSSGSGRQRACSTAQAQRGRHKTRPQRGRPAVDQGGSALCWRPPRRLPPGRSVKSTAWTASSIVIPVFICNRDSCARKLTVFLRSDTVFSSATKIVEACSSWSSDQQHGHVACLPNWCCFKVSAHNPDKTMLALGWVRLLSTKATPVYMWCMMQSWRQQCLHTIRVYRQE